MRIIVGKHLLACCVITSFVLTGCKGLGDIVNFSDSGDAGNRSEGVQGKFIDRVRTDLKSDDGSTSSTERQAAWKKDVGYIRYGNKTVANLPQLQSYVNNVFAKLRSSLPGTPVSATVYITPQKDFEAYTLEHGAIFISLGTLLSLENEDELAALLAHEYAHVLLNHHSKDTFEILTRYGMRYANIYLQTRSNAKSQEKRMKTLKIANWVTDKALFPNWNKGQENDADILAVDLLLQSNYNADAMTAMLKKVELTVLEKKDFVAQNPVKVTKAAKDQSKLNIDLDVLAANAVGSLEHQLDRDYESAKVRQKRVRDYLKQEYKKRPRPGYQTAVYSTHFQERATKSRVGQYLSAHKAEQTLMLDKQGLNKAAPLCEKAIGGSLGEDPYARMLMYYIRNSQKRADNAQINLEKAYATGGAPMYAYELLVEQHMQRKQFEQAKVLQEEMETEFDKPAEMLPNMITVQKQLGNITSMLLLRCLATGDAELIKQCNLASKS
ncbi:MAG: M48 family metallopeptidase [Gammaproteobacteria bacterium]|nr:M48 family metallopeptidase [Gammaproteobacteria bacterium]